MKTSKTRKITATFSVSNGKGSHFNGQVPVWKKGNAEKTAAQIIAAAARAGFVGHPISIGYAPAGLSLSTILA